MQAPDNESFTWRDLDWSEWDEEEPVGWQEIHPETPDDHYEVEGRAFEALDTYCIAPGCECREVTLFFHEILDDEDDDGNEEEGSVAIVWLEMSSGDLVGTRNLPGERDLLERLWAAYRTRHPLSELEGREAEMLRIAPEIHALADVQTPPEPIERGPKVGRNDPCACGSGKKFKKCCGA